jgi:hypothetical protein
MDIRSGWDWQNDFWLDLSNAYLWNTAATKHILENSLPFPIFVSTGYETRNREEFFFVENTLLYSGLPVDPRKLNENSSFGGGFVQVSFIKLSVSVLKHSDGDVTGIHLNFLAISPPRPKGVALNAESLKNDEPVPSDDNILYLKEFKNPSPVIKIAELTSAASAFAAASDVIFKIDIQNSITIIRKILNRIGNVFNGELTMINNIIDYLDPGKREIYPSHMKLKIEKKMTKLLFHNHRQLQVVVTNDRRRSG